MAIWVDADACPVALREIICRAANRTSTPATFVANHFIPLPKSAHVKARQVCSGFDVADNEIVASVQHGDLVITSDIPLAAEVIEKNTQVVNYRGEEFTRENIRARLSLRDFLDTMRSSGVQTGGPAALSRTDIQKFSNVLDRYFAKNKNS